MELKESAEKYKNILTIDEVFIESRLVGLTSPTTLEIQKISPDENFHIFYDLLEEKAVERGIIEYKDNYLQADLKLASMTFSLSANYPEKVFFLSSDRQLLEFIFERDNYIISNL